MGLPAQALNRGSTYPVKQLLGALCTTGLQVIIEGGGSSLQIEAILSKKISNNLPTKHNIKARTRAIILFRQASATTGKFYRLTCP